jgi:hypothetical protein
MDRIAEDLHKKRLARRPFLLAAGAILWPGGCGFKNPDEAAGPVVLRATDDSSQIKLPAGWKAQKDLNKTAKIQAGDTTRQEFLVVLTEGKQTLTPGIDFRDHARAAVVAFQKKIEAARETGTPKDMIINSMLALRHEFTGIAGENRVPIYYLHTTVEGVNAFHQLIAWTLLSRIRENRQDLEDVIQSFEDFT